MASEKIYAIVFPNGRHQVLKSTWDKVKVMVEGVSGIKYKSFPDEDSANKWAGEKKLESKKAATQSKTKREIQKKHHVSNTEWMSQNVNTPYWNKIKKSEKNSSKE